MPLRVVHPRAGRSLPLALILILLVAGPVVGQLGGVEPFGVTVRSDSAQGTTTGDCVSFSAIVTNTGSFPASDRIIVQLGQAPAGWRVQAPETTQFDLAADASRDVAFALCPTDGIRAGDSASVQFTAIVDSDPRDPKASSSMVFAAEYQTEGIFGFDLPPAVLYGVMLGVLGLLGIVLISRRRPVAGIAISCPEPAKEVLPNRGTSFPIRIANEGRDRDVVTLTTSPVPQGWDTFLPLVDVPLEPREEQTVWLSVKSPPDARPGDRVIVKVIARSAAGGPANAEIDTLTSVRTPDTPPEPPKAPIKPEPTFTEMPWGDDEEDPVLERSVYDRADGEPPRTPGPRAVAVKRRKS